MFLVEIAFACEPAILHIRFPAVNRDFRQPIPPFTNAIPHLNPTRDAVWASLSYCTGMIRIAYFVPPNITNGLCVCGCGSFSGRPDSLAIFASKIMICGGI